MVPGDHLKSIYPGLLQRISYGPDVGLLLPDEHKTAGAERLSCERFGPQEAVDIEGRFPKDSSEKYEVSVIPSLI